MTQESWEIRVYQDEKGSHPFEQWTSTLDVKTKTRVRARLDRIEQGNFGDCKSLGKGLYELRLFFGPGYRIYYAIAGERIVLLLAGGDKKGQSRDIKAARALWNRYQSTE